jgi:hypothetical protein
MSRITCRPMAVFALAIVLAEGMAAPSACAATYRVDDSSSLPRESSAVLDWRNATPSRNGSDALEGVTSLALRLDVAAWMNRVGRLYLVLPEQTAPITRLQWRTQGRLQPGQALPGQRVLVYQGPIQTPWLEERIDLIIEASGSRLSGMQLLNFHFEIDVD